MHLQLHHHHWWVAFSSAWDKSFFNLLTFDIFVKMKWKNLAKNPMHRRKHTINLNMMNNVKFNIVWKVRKYFQVQILEYNNYNHIVNNCCPPTERHREITWTKTKRKSYELLLHLSIQTDLSFQQYFLQSKKNGLILDILHNEEFNLGNN